MRSEEWTKSEKAAARRAFDLALEREYAKLAGEVRDRADRIAGPDDIWRLHDFLTKRRKEIDEKYDYRYSMLVWVFARLVNEGRIGIADLEGLGEKKLAEIRMMTEIGRR
jgi:hypothetical protein